MKCAKQRVMRNEARVYNRNKEMIANNLWFGERIKSSKTKSLSEL